MKNDIIKLKVNVSLDVSFKKYSSTNLNEKAKEQILIWIEETLKDESQIPLFVFSNSGEETLSKNVKIESVEDVTTK